ncbi:helix-turn-helix transcriptional regulator [Pseudogulbenkiania sp. MAI-1]|uniref:helix-turn-helix transcriptional regulator n=1 Tax=Pseudogulbenkiania sp. MAI-1 TaxID=990370 RepID=UPI00045EBE95|nr:helix-turn-helix transcriptional regulator [Pseudogulbenkiania sp. MAI-1]
MTPIEAARKRLGMTQSELAEKAGCTQGHISQLEKGLTNPSRELAKRLATALELTVMEILYPEDAEKK